LSSAGEARNDDAHALSAGADALTVVIVNWRTPELALGAAEALFVQGVEPERMIVVDNGSGDGSVAYLQHSLRTGIVLMRLPENVGFARANNLAARALPATGAYLLVNSDAFAEPGAVAALLASLGDERVGVAVPRLLNADRTLQESVHPCSTPLPEAIRAAGLSRLVPNRLRPRLSAHWDHARSARVQAAIGAVLLVRAETWAQLGGFDERFALYAEDLDLFWRLRALGRQARFVAEAEFVHLGGASSDQRWADTDRARVKATAEAAMLRTHLSRVPATATLALMATGTAARALVSLLRGERTRARTFSALTRGYLTRPGGRVI
jgi:N-acetylglucosaminyl-diphospho-decaprenol L-rhamnosyltransferase